MNITSQMVRGALATSLVITISLMLCVSISPKLLLGWGTLIPVALVPAQIVVSQFWRGQYPIRIASLRQPFSGLTYLGLTITAGYLVAWASWSTVGGGISPPTPFTNMFLILSVSVTLWLVIVFQAWPLSMLSKHAGIVGTLLWLAAYAITYGLFRTLFNFGFLKDSPAYFSQLDPAGVFMAWIPLVFSIASAMVLLSLVLFDFWPLSLLIKRIPLFGKQPLFSVTALTLIAILTSTTWIFFIDWLQMDLVVFLVRVCVSVIFGQFILLVMLEGVPWITLAQPWRGCFLAGAATLLGMLVYPLYRSVASHFFDMPSGQPTYVLELWIASAMLAITFPLMVLFAGYFKFWPLPQLKPANND